MLPTELFFTVFGFVPPKDLLRSRQVCSKWRDIIDTMLKNDGLWEIFCKHDYNNIYKKAMWKSPNITNWHEMYRSLSSWSKLGEAHETIEEFCLSDSIDDELRNAVVQKNGVVMVHKRTTVVFHDIVSLRVVRRQGFSGQIISLIELEDIVVMLEWNGQLHVVNKPNKNWHSDLLINTNSDNEIFFNDVRSFIVGDRTVFFVTYNQELFSFNFDEDKAANKISLREFSSDLIPNSFDALGYSAGCLYILTPYRNIFMYVNKQAVLKLSLDTVENIMHCFYIHNMLENMDWRHYYSIVCQRQHEPHQGELKYIRKISIYHENIFYVCFQSGKVFVYYKPFVNGELNLNECKPIKVYDFSKRMVHPFQSMIPIVNIDFTETTDGHIVLICMPMKILKVSYKHDFEMPVSKAISA